MLSDTQRDYMAKLETWMAGEWGEHPHLVLKARGRMLNERNVDTEFKEKWVRDRVGKLAIRYGCDIKARPYDEWLITRPLKSQG